MITIFPDTGQRLRRKIARLEARRDRELRIAPTLFYVRRTVVLMFLFVVTVQFLTVLFSLSSGRPSPYEHPHGFLLLFGACAAGLGYWSWRVWSVPPPADGDLWAYSDLVGSQYEGDSPRDLQARIDTLRAQLVREDDARQ